MRGLDPEGARRRSRRGEFGAASQPARFPDQEAARGTRLLDWKDRRKSGAGNNKVRTKPREKSCREHNKRVLKKKKKRRKPLFPRLSCSPSSRRKEVRGSDSGGNRMRQVQQTSAKELGGCFWPRSPVVVIRLRTQRGGGRRRHGGPRAAKGVLGDVRSTWDRGREKEVGFWICSRVHQ